MLLSKEDFSGYLYLESQFINNNIVSVRLLYSSFKYSSGVNFYVFVNWKLIKKIKFQTTISVI